MFAKEKNSIEPTGKNKGIIKWLILLVVIVLVIAFGMKRYSSPQQRLNEQLDLGQKYLEEGNYEEAVVAFNKAIEIEPMSVEAYLGLAEAYVGTGDLEAAVAALEKGDELTGDAQLREKIAEIERLMLTLELPFEWEDITIKGYNLFDDYYLELCDAFHIKADTDPSSTTNSGGVMLKNEYGYVGSSWGPITINGDSGYVSKIIGFSHGMKLREDVVTYYPHAISYSIYGNKISLRVNGYRSTDNEIIADFSAYPWELYDINCPILPGVSLEEVHNLLGVDEILQKGFHVYGNKDSGSFTYEFVTKDGNGTYSEYLKGDGLGISLTIYDAETNNELFALDLDLHENYCDGFNVTVYR
ncbi:MAG: tetratricopeptide repeat protein [Lachnospiraceae bacterium]|nr:tetratricopeptide repeat protein [Lachnospiraceae bacterium]